MNKNTEQKALHLTVNELIFLFTLLAEAMLHGQKSRSRNRITRILKERVDEYEVERRGLLEEYGKKDKEGKLVMTPGGGNFVIVDQKRFTKEFEELLDSNVVIDVLPSNKEDFVVVRDIILNLQRDFNYQQGELYESICSKLEKV